jgi:hypothetical protein
MVCLNSESFILRGAIIEVSLLAASALDKSEVLKVGRNIRQIFVVNRGSIFH